jgi:integrase
MKMLHDIEYDAVELYFKRRNRASSSGKKPSADQLRIERCLLRQIYKWGIIRRHASHDPTYGVKIARPLPGENRVLDLEEVTALLKACQEGYAKRVSALRNAGGRRGGTVTRRPRTFSQTFSPPAWLHDIVVLALVTGLRLGNLVELVWGHIDLKRKRIDLPAVSMKNRRPMTVFLNEDAYTILRNRRGRRVQSAKDRVFPNLDRRTVERCFDKAVKRAKIKRCRFHDLRKTCASWLAAAGVNLNAVMAITGHRTLDVTLRSYLAVTESQRREAVERIRLPAV